MEKDFGISVFYDKFLFKRVLFGPEMQGTNGYWYFSYKSEYFLLQALMHFLDICEERIHTTVICVLVQNWSV